MGEPTIDTIKKNLSEVEDIICKTKKELDEDGSRFNIFYILNLETSEVRLHSAFIAELLDPGGMHSFKMEFLELFIKDLKQKFGNHKSLLSFDVSSVKVEVEKWVGFINDDYTRGGKIDLVISDNKNRIIIENKITAGDQPKQLLRYHNYDPNALLLYLTLNGDEPSINSTGGTLNLNEDFFLISYEKFILQWLLKCYEIASDKPKVKETISQYMNLIKDYTSQSPIHKMKEKITNLISSDIKFYSSIEDIYTAYQALNQSITNKFWERLKNKIPLDAKLMDLSVDIDLHYSINEDSDGFFFGFYIRKKNMEQVYCSLPEYQPLVNALKGLRSKVGSNHNYICWIFPDTMPRRIDQLSKEQIFDLQDNAKMESLINQIAEEFTMVTDEVTKRLRNTKIE